MVRVAERGILVLAPALTSSNDGSAPARIGGGLFLGPERIGRAAEVAKLADILPGGESARDLDDRLLAHAEDDQVGLGVEQDPSV